MKKILTVLLAMAISLWASSSVHASSMNWLKAEEGYTPSLGALLVSDVDGKNLLAFYEADANIDYVATLFADITASEISSYFSDDAAFQFNQGYLIVDWNRDDVIASLISPDVETLVVWHKYIEYDNSGSFVGHGWHHQSYNLAAVPLPAAFYLFIVGLVALFTARKRKSEQLTASYA